ncbi:MAG: enolase [Promethearchaeota archaeon]|nr:MAG: enolase [Candidatus Lokiarchaeota archaeon]
MTNFKITDIKSRWILDSRGNPTVESTVFCGKKSSRAAVPSGASTGEEEALELRDGGSKFKGKHVSKAVNNVNEILAEKLKGYDVREQSLLDGEMRKIDGTENKANLGANAILSVSLAAARLAAKLSEISLYEHIYEMSYSSTTDKFLLPVPSSNIINGGEHAGNDLAVQEFMILPLGAKNFPTAVRMISEVYHTLKNLLGKKFGKTAINVGDEGGFAPNISLTRDAFNVIIEAVEEAGYKLGEEFYLGIDAAASEFFEENVYHIDGKKLSEEELVQYYLNLVNEYSALKSIEDPFDEKAFDAFSSLTKEIGNRVQIVDDDLTVTNIDILQKAININAGNALLLKVNQIGSLTESIEAAKLSFKNGYNVMVSHRSGETEDPFIADLAVGLCSGQIKPGAPCRSDRNAKYNQLLRIHEDLGEKAEYPKSLDSWKKFH